MHDAHEHNEPEPFDESSERPVEDAIADADDAVADGSAADGATAADATADDAVADDAAFVPVAPAPAPEPSCKRSPRQERERALSVHKWVRYAIQITFFVLAPALFSGAFNGVKYLFLQIGATTPIELTAFVVLLVAVLAFTIVFGRFFCGYACAFGTLGDVLYAACEFVRSKTLLPRIVFPSQLVRVLSLLKYAVLAAICVACFFGVWGAYSGYSPWVAFAAVLSGSLEGADVAAYVVLGVIVVCMVVRERFFCQFLCPLGAVFSLMPVFGFSEYKRTRAHCAKTCGRCADACPVDIWPDADSLGHGECISCGRCADACPMANVNLLAVEKRASHGKRGDDAEPARPLRKTRETWILWRGTGVVYTVAKAALLLAICWAVGTTRYFPSIADVFGPMPWLP